MSHAITLAMQNAEKAQAFLIAYDFKFKDAMASNGKVVDYVADYTYRPPVSPNTHIVRMAIPLSAPELKLFKGRRHFRKNSAAFIDLTSVPYDDGVEEDADRIAAFDWTGFSTSAQSIANAIKAWPSRAVVQLINSGNTYTDWTGGNFLSASKYANPFKTGTSTTFQNYWTATTLNTTNVQRLIADMVARRGFDGNPLGFGERNLVLFASAALYPTALSIANDANLPGLASNPIVKYKLKVEMWPHLDSNKWGIIQGDAMDSHPVFGTIQGPTETLILGKDSAKYELTNQMGYNAKLRLGAGLLRYEAISVAVEP